MLIVLYFIIVTIKGLILIVNKKRKKIKQMGRQDERRDRNEERGEEKEEE